MKSTVRRVVAAAAVAFLLAGCGSAVEASTPTEVTEADAGEDAKGDRPVAKPTWSRVAAWPGPNWGHSLSVWTGREVLVLGAVHENVPGVMSSGGGPKDFPTRAGAAAYDPGRDTWRTLSKPPFRLGEASLAVAGGVVYAHTMAYGATYKDVTAELYAWSPDDDTWRKLPSPPLVGKQVLWGDVLAAGPNLVVAGFTEDSNDQALAYDPEARTWSRLPDAPWKRISRSEIVGLPDGRLVAFGAPDYQEPGDEPSDRAPKVWHAAVLDPGAARWRQLPPSPITIGDGVRRGRWMLVGGLLVNAADGTVPLYDKFSYTPKGGARDAARSLLPTPPTGGVLDVDTGTWSLLADRPKRDHPLGGAEPVGWLSAAAGELAILDGWGYDPRRREWTDFPPTPSAPDGLAGTALVWAGDRLLAFAVSKIVASPDGDGYRIELDNVGWSWTPDVEG